MVCNGCKYRAFHAIVLWIVLWEFAVGRKDRDNFVARFIELKEMTF